MKYHFDKAQVNIYLDKICLNESFSKSPRNTRILKYLTEQALLENYLKEQTIGLELFKENYNVNKNDGIVRVYMYNLRKKLSEYYSNSGKDDAVVFVLEKGSYNLKFIPKSEIISKNETEEKPSTRKWILYALAILLPVIGIVGYFSFFHKNETYLWNSFFEKDVVNTCILADHLTLTQQLNGKKISFVNAEVKNVEEFIDLIKKEDNDSIKMTDFTLYSKAIPFSLHHLTKWFSENNKVFSLIPESELRFDDVKQNNFIYIGQFKTMNLSRGVFLKNSKDFDTDKFSFYLNENGEKKKMLTKYENNSVASEYAMVSYLTLENGNTALFFVSNNDIGTMATVNQFTNLNFLKEFYKKLPSTKTNFNALFKVEGIERTETHCELVHLEVIEN